MPGNVFVLSDGSTDELFSNLAGGDVDNVERVVVELDEKDRPLPAPVRVADDRARTARRSPLASRETYYAINQPVPNSNPPRRRFVQLRSIEDPQVAAAVHNIELYPGGQWFGRGRGGRPEPHPVRPRRGRGRDARRGLSARSGWPPATRSRWATWSGWSPG